MSESVRQEAGLRVRLESEIPERLVTGRGNSLLVHGWAFHPESRLRELTLLAGERPGATLAHSRPRPDVHEAIPRTEDPDGNSYWSSFWGMVDFDRRPAPGKVELKLRARLRDGRTAESALGSVALTPALSRGELSGRWETLVQGQESAIAIVMPTYNPKLDLFRAQVESLREQTHQNWSCLICDDHSDEETFREIGRIVAGDHRFLVFRGEQRLGFYRNYERALTFVPPNAPLVALADQDDRWDPDKLATLKAALGPDKLLAYSNMRVAYYADGACLPLYDTYWEAVQRANEYRSLATILIANSVTGAASLFRRQLLSYLLPMPHSPGPCFHDHWLAVVALSLGEVAFVKRSLQDYVLHEENATYEVDISWRYPGKFVGPAQKAGESTGKRSEALLRWRSAYVGEVLHLAIFARVALSRTRDVVRGGKRRALERGIAVGRWRPGFGWMARRWLRPAWLRSSTRGLETLLMRALLWFRLSSIETRLGRKVTRHRFEAGPLA